MKIDKPKFKRLLTATPLCVTLVACGGGGGGGVQSDASTLLSGVLLDSAVSGIHYEDALTGSTAGSSIRLVTACIFASVASISEP